MQTIQHISFSCASKQGRGLKLLYLPSTTNRLRTDSSVYFIQDLSKWPAENLNYMLRCLRLILITISVIFLSYSNVACQVTLGASPYTQNFNRLGTDGLPEGWTVRTSASAAVIGTEQIFSTAHVNWGNLEGKFGNVASNDGLTSSASNASQAASADRALSVRQTASFGDPGAAFVFQIANTVNLYNFSLTFDLMSLVAVTRTTTWEVDYGFGAVPASFSAGATLPSVLTTGSLTKTKVTVNFGTALNNHSGPVWIRLISKVPSIGDNARPRTAIDNVSLSYTADADADGFDDAEDNCLNIPNTDQADMDDDGIGDVCDNDIDGDGVDNAQDCAPLDGTKWRSGTLYIDADGDGYTKGSATVCYGAEVPEGYKAEANSDDCNDDPNNGGAAVYQSATLYVDADGDGYTVGNGETVCYGASIPSGYSAIKSKTDDCNDDSNNGGANINPGVAPAIIAPANKTGDNSANTSDDGTGNCTTTVALGTPRTNNNCTQQTIEAFVGEDKIDPATYAFTKGVTTVRWVVTDAQGRMAEDEQEVMVIDDEIPTITFDRGNNTIDPTEEKVHLTINMLKDCKADVPTDLFSYFTITDNCGIKSKSFSLKPGDPLNTVTHDASHKMTLTVVDNNNNETKFDLHLIIKDVTAPSITAPDVVTVGTDLNSCNATGVDFGYPSVSDEVGCTLPVGSVTNDAPAIFPLGKTVVTWTVIDAGGNKATAKQDVFVEDRQKPWFTTEANALDKSFATAEGTCIRTMTAAQIGKPEASDNCTLKSVEGVRSDNKPLTDPFPFGITTITWTATDNANNTEEYEQKININQATTVTTVVVTPLNATVSQDALPANRKQQYSDKVTLTATVSPLCTAAGASAQSSIMDPTSVVTFQIGNRTMGTAPVQADGTASLTVTLLELQLGQTVMSQGDKMITATFSGYGAYLASSGITGLTITPEDACTEYNGQLSVSGTAVNKTTNKATITLSVGLEDKNDGSRGDIRNAIVQFKMDGYNNGNWFTVSVKPLNAENTLGNASILADVTFSGTSNTYNFYYKISGYYQIGNPVNKECNPDAAYNLIENAIIGAAVINVYLPQNEFITGGGYIKVGNNSVGEMPAGADTRANFGFNVKYTKKGTQLQGNINYIFRKFEEYDQRVHVYQVKGNSMTNLSVSSEGSIKTSVFNGKCNLTDLTTGLSVDGTGNSTMQVVLADKGEPGTNDEYGITVWKSDGTVLHSNNWISTKTVKQTIAKGNIVVHDGSGTSVDPSLTSVKDVNSISLVTGLALKAFPNPATLHFNLKVESNNVKDAITLKVFNQLGQVVDVKRNLFSGQVIQVGAAYKQGTYFVEVTQGEQKQNLQLVKTN